MIQKMVTAATVLCLLGCNAAQITTPKEPTACLFSYFLENGQDGLHLAYSHDGLTWTALKDGKSFLPPKVGGKLMRDPCICTGPDGEFHMVWTSNWQGRVFCYATSPDLVKWSDSVMVTPFPASLPADDQPGNVWAPEIHRDPVRDDLEVASVKEVKKLRKSMGGFTMNSRKMETKLDEEVA